MIPRCALSYTLTVFTVAPDMTYIVPMEVPFPYPEITADFMTPPEDA